MQEAGLGALWNSSLISDSYVSAATGPVVSTDLMMESRYMPAVPSSRIDLCFSVPFWKNSHLHHHGVRRVLDLVKSNAAARVSEAIKVRMARTSVASEPLTEALLCAEVRKFFQLGDDVSLETHGNLNAGEAVFIVNKADVLQYAVVPSASVRPEEYIIDTTGRVTDVIYGAAATKADIQFPMTVKTTGGTREINQLVFEALVDRSQSYANAVNTDSALKNAGWGKMGIEIEVFVLERATGRLSRYHGNEFTVGMHEEDVGGFYTVTEATQAMARLHLQIRQIFPEEHFMILVTASPPSQDLPDANVYVGSDFVTLDGESYGPYTAKTLGLSRNNYGAKTKLGQNILGDIAEAYGFESVQALLQTKNFGDLWASAATQVSFGHAHFYDQHLRRQVIEANEVINSTDVMTSAFVALADIATLSSPLFSCVVGRGLNNDVLRDTRFDMRLNLGTVDPLGLQEIGTPERAVKIIRENIIRRDSPSDRLPRAGVVGRSGQAVAHDIVRKRDEFLTHSNGIQMHSGRTESAGAGITTLQARTTMLAIKRVLQIVAKLATQHGMNVTDYMASKMEIDRDRLRFNPHEIVMEFNRMGPRSQLFTEFSNYFRMLLSHLGEDYPHAEDQTIQEALLGLAALSSEGNLDQLAQGIGTLGGAIRTEIIALRNRGYSDAKIAYIISIWIDLYATQEATFVAGLNPEALQRFTRREAGAGFRFQRPGVNTIEFPPELALTLVFDFRYLS